MILIELVFVARIASGFKSAANEENMDCLSDKDSETACPFFLEACSLQLRDEI